MARILYVEDDPGSRLLVKKLLQAAGHEVLLATTGLEGIRTAEKETVDLVLVDINVPDLDGYEVTLRLRGTPRMERVPIVALTAEGDRQTSLAVGCDGFLEKPIDARRFAKSITRFLEGHRERADDTGEQKLRAASQRISERLEKKVIELSAANQKLEEAARLRRDFLQNLSHELATPLTPVVGYVKMLAAQELGALTPQQKRALQGIETSTARLRALVEMLIDVSALETGRMSFGRRDYDFARIVTRAVDDARGDIAERRLELHLLVPQRAMPAMGDPDKVRRACSHILDNARKFTPKGGAIAIEVARQPRGPEYELRVADSGPGIPKERLHQVLEPFFQVDASPTRAHGGVGLGLAFAHKVAQAHGGDVIIFGAPFGAVAGARLSGAEVHLRVAARPSSMQA